MESQEEYDKEVQELYDQIQQQMDQEINEAKKRWQERQTQKIVEEEDKDALLNQTQLTLDDDETAIIAFITTNMFLTKQPRNASPSLAPGTMPSTSKTTSVRATADDLVEI